MSVNHSRDLLDDLDKLAARVRDLESSRVLGAQAAVCTSTTHPAPAPGRVIQETDTGLYAIGNGTTFVYPPQLIKKVVLNASAPSVPIPATGTIPQVFTNLRLVISAKSDGTGASGYDNAFMTFNNVSTAIYNFSTWYMAQGGGTVLTAGGTTQMAMQCAAIWNSHFASQGRGISTLDIPNYGDAAAYKTFTGLSAATDGGAAGVMQTYSGGIGSGAAITSLAIAMGTGNFIAGSEFALYGWT